jgi:homoserine acetyltransferase
MAAEFVQDYETFDLGDFTLQHGATLKDAKLAYKTFGKHSARFCRELIAGRLMTSGSRRGSGRRG